MTKHLRLTILGGLFVFAAATASTSAWSDGDTHKSLVTFNRAVAIPGAELSAGTYIFELANPHASLDLVRVSSPDRKKVYLTAFTNIIDRPAGLGANRSVTLGEAPRDGAPPVKAWFPGKSGNGYEFRYRK